PTRPPPRSTLFPYTTLFRSLHVGRVQLAKPLAPAIQRLFADLVPAGDLGHRCPVRLAQDRHHLFFGKSALSHGLLASGRGPFSQDRKSTRLNSSHVKISYAV